VCDFIEGDIEEKETEARQSQQPLEAPLILVRLHIK